MPGQIHLNNVVHAFGLCNVRDVKLLEHSSRALQVLLADAKALVDAAGIGAEPASCATVAGIRRLVQEGVIGSDERVVGILTGNVLKDPDIVVNYHAGELEGIESRRVNAPISARADLDEIRRIIRQ